MKLDKSWRPQLIVAASAVVLGLLLLVGKELLAPERSVPLVSTLTGLFFFVALVAAIAGVWGYVSARRSRTDPS